MKSSLLIQLRAGGHALGEFHSAEYVLTQCGGRVLNALVEFLTMKEGHAAALLAALQLRRSLVGSLGWHDNPIAAVRQLDGTSKGASPFYWLLLSTSFKRLGDEESLLMAAGTLGAGVGPAYSEKLRDAGAGSLAGLAQLLPTQIERVCGKGAPFGTVILRATRALLESRPILSYEVGRVGDGQPVPFTLRLARRPQAGGGGGPKHSSKDPARWILLVGDVSQKVHLIRRLRQSEVEAKRFTQRPTHI